MASNKARVAAAANKIKDLTRAGVKIRGGSALTQAGMASAKYRADLPAGNKATTVGGVMRGTSGRTPAHAAQIKAANDIAANQANFRGAGVDTTGVKRKKK